jgi:NitT/TauT family transport system substrate-binding protein
MSRELGSDMGYLSWAKAGINPYGLSIFVNSDYLQANKDVVARFIKVTQHAYQECVKSPDPCVKALVDQVSGLKSENETVNWKLTMELMSDEVSRTRGLGFMDQARMQNDYNLVTKYLGVTAPFDIRAMYTDEFLDPSITMVDVPEMKF